MSKKIYRSRMDKMIGGVCGGIAEYFDIDSTLVRLALLLLFFARGTGLLIYIIAWVIVPEKPHINERIEYSQDEEAEEFAENGSMDDKVEVVNIDNMGEGKQNGNEEDGKIIGSSVVKGGKEKHQQIFGIILVFLGAFFLLEHWLPFFRWERYWPLIIVGLGFAILLKGVKDNE